jgi:hypothetical protein
VVAPKINAQGQVEGTCVGTGMALDPACNCYRRTSVHAAHGYGPVLPAGAEMIALNRGAGATATLIDRTIQFASPASTHCISPSPRFSFSPETAKPTLP